MPFQSLISRHFAKYTLRIKAGKTCDFNKNPIEKVDGDSSREDIMAILNKYGISKSGVEIWGSGRPRREFLWSEDMADACVFLLENRDFVDTFSRDEKEIKNTHINIGTGVDISIKDLAYKIKEEIGYSGKFNFNLSKPDGTMKKLTDVSKLNNLGWKYSVNIDQGIRKIYVWYLS